MTKVLNRRRFLRVVFTGSTIGVAGCFDIETATETGTDRSATRENTRRPAVTATDTTESDQDSDDSESTSDEQQGGDGDPLVGGGSSAVYPIANSAASYWNANRPTTDTEYWPHDEYNIDTDRSLADYWAGLYGFEATESGDPPFFVQVGLSDSATGVRKVMDGNLDIGNASGSVEGLLPENDSDGRFTDYVVGVDGQSIVVSSEVADAGISTITGQQLRDIYTGRVSNWSELGGPDREIRVVGGGDGSGARVSFLSNVFGDPDAATTVDNRYKQNQRLAVAVAEADDAISYLARAFIDIDGLTPIGLQWDGTTYAYRNDQHGLDAPEYPLSRDLHMYTWDGTTEREAAFVNMVLSDFGQDTFVAESNYFRLSATRREAQRNKLPDQSA